MAGRRKKEKVVSFKVNPDFYNEFKEWTDFRGLTISSALRDYMRTKIEEHKDNMLRMKEQEQRLNLG